jgi:hypothetical protein
VRGLQEKQTMAMLEAFLHHITPGSAQPLEPGCG